MALPAPFYQDALVTLYLGDCRDLLPQFPGLSFDWAVLDPPQRDGDPALYAPLMAQVRPLLQAVAAHVLEVTHAVHQLGTGNKRDQLVNTRCDLLIDGSPSTVTAQDPDLKVVGWGGLISPHAPASVIDPFCGAGGWILLACKRAAIPSVGIGTDPAYLAQAAARLQVG